MEIELPNDLVSAIEERRIIPFIGAGFSKNIHSDIPNWSEVINESAELLDYDYDILKLQGDFYQIAEYLSLKGELGNLYNKLYRKIESSKYKVEHSKPHQLLPYLDVQSIYTTNWDSWIEVGFKNQQIPFSKIITHEDFVKSAKTKSVYRSTSPDLLYDQAALDKIKNKYRETVIVKFHGDFNNHDSIVFRESNYYDRLDFEHPLDIRLRSEIIGKSMLFIGYSFSDTNVRYVWHKLNKMMKNISNIKKTKSYFVTHFNNPLLREVFTQNNIETILLNPRDIPENIKSLFEKIIEIQLNSD
jgi:hypothetical protein